MKINSNHAHSIRQFWPSLIARLVESFLLKRGQCNAIIPQQKNAGYHEIKQMAIERISRRLN